MSCDKKRLALLKKINYRYKNCYISFVKVEHETRCEMHHINPVSLMALMTYPTSRAPRLKIELKIIFSIDEHRNPNGVFLIALNYQPIIQ